MSKYQSPLDKANAKVRELKERVQELEHELKESVWEIEDLRELIAETRDEGRDLIVDLVQFFDARKDDFSNDET
jgi:uncharacterized coiled-coil DUF342 family protein